MCLAPLGAFWRNGLYDREVWIAHINSVGETDGHRIHHDGTLYICGTGQYLTTLQDPHPGFPEVHESRVAHCIGDFLFGTCAAKPHGKTGAHGL